MPYAKVEIIRLPPVHEYKFYITGEDMHPEYNEGEMLHPLFCYIYDKTKLSFEEAAQIFKKARIKYLQEELVKYVKDHAELIEAYCSIEAPISSACG